MKKLFSLNALLLVILCLSFSNCKKNGLGGKAEIKGYAFYKSKTQKPTTFYIKYGAKSMPGSDVSKYDASSNSDTDGKFDFKNLYKGDYYIYAVSVDGGQTITGGVHVSLSSSDFKDNIQIDLAP